MPRVRIERADRIPIYAGPPQRMARKIGVRRIAEDLAVDLEVGAGAALVAPQRMLAQHAVFRLQIFLPQRRRLDHMAVGVEHREIFRRHPLLPGVGSGPIS